MPPPAPPPEIRVEIAGALPAGTKWIYAALSPNPAFCDESSDDSCGEIYQVELPPPDGGVFRLVIPEALRAFDFPTGNAKPSLRVEARADDHCILARGSRLLDGTGTVRLDLAAPPARVCSLFLVVVGASTTTIRYGEAASCPAGVVGVNSLGTLCLTEQPKGIPVKLAAIPLEPAFFDFSRWEGYADCASRTQPDCTLPMNGPAAVRAVFRRR